MESLKISPNHNKTADNLLERNTRISLKIEGKLKLLF
jgi:hypothetical protein